MLKNLPFWTNMLLHICLININNCTLWLHGFECLLKREINETYKIRMCGTNILDEIFLYNNTKIFAKINLFGTSTNFIRDASLITNIFMSFRTSNKIFDISKFENKLKCHYVTKLTLFE